ncbi:hypothetical protein XHV734_2784 [Xanthomonas hortorum pv. vitians]|nr:hypothetical protein XHV734_2784 [Xanthomonas hortorum pv. vitians]
MYETRRRAQASQSHPNVTNVAGAAHQALDSW